MELGIPRVLVYSNPHNTTQMPTFNSSPAAFFKGWNSTLAIKLIELRIILVFIVIRLACQDCITFTKLWWLSKFASRDPFQLCCLRSLPGNCWGLNLEFSAHKACPLFPEMWFFSVVACLHMS